MVAQSGSGHNGKVPTKIIMLTIEAPVAVHACAAGTADPRSSDMAGKNYDVLIIGGGNAGISLAARLRRYGVKDLAVLEPGDQHFYQPLFSHIAGGRATASEATRPQRAVMPEGVD